MGRYNSKIESANGGNQNARICVGCEKICLLKCTGTCSLACVKTASGRPRVSSRDEK